MSGFGHAFQSGRLQRCSAMSRWTWPNYCTRSNDEHHRLQKSNMSKQSRCASHSAQSEMLFQWVALPQKAFQRYSQRDTHREILTGMLIERYSPIDIHTERCFPPEHPFSRTMCISTVCKFVCNCCDGLWLSVQLRSDQAASKRFRGEKFFGTKSCSKRKVRTVERLPVQ